MSLDLDGGFDMDAMALDLPLNGDALFSFEALELEQLLSDGPPPAVTPQFVPELTAEERLFMKMPELIMSYVNRGMMDELRLLISKYIAKECVFLTIALNEAGKAPKLGPESVFEFLSSLSESHPDAIMRLNSVAFENIEADTFCVVFSNSFTGTETFTDTEGSELYKNPGLDYALKIQESYHNALSPEERSILESKQNAIQAGKALAKVKVLGYGRLTINRSTRLVVKYDSWWEYKALETVDKTTLARC